MATLTPQEPTRLLATFAAALRYDDLPARSQNHCKNLILDALACAVAGYQGEETQQVRAVAAGDGRFGTHFDGAAASVVTTGCDGGCGMIHNREQHRGVKF